MKFSSLEILVIISTLLEFNPLLQALKSLKNKSVQGVSLGTFASIMTIGGLWLFYGISIKNLPLIIGNSIKLFSALAVIVIWWKYRN